MSKQAKILKEAFGHQDALIAYVYVILQDWGLAEDVVQDLFVTLSAKWESFDDQRRLYPWLKRIVRNRAVDIIRSRSREFYCADDEILDLVERAFEQEDTEVRLDRRSRMNAILKKCLAKLQKKSRDLLQSFYLSSQSCAEIALESDKSENSIYISLTRSRQQLRKCTNRHFNEVE